MNRKNTFFPRSKMEKLLANFVDEVYSKHCTEIGLKLDVDTVSVPEMEVRYKTYILPQDFCEDEEVEDGEDD